MKHIILLCLSLMLVCPLLADEMYLGYCDGDMGSATTTISGSNKTIQCAISMPAENVGSLVGQQITRIRVGVNPNCTKLPSYVIAWVRSSANGDNLVEKKVAVEAGWNDIALDEPLTVPAATELWIGFSYPQTSTKLKVVTFGGTPVEGHSYWTNNASVSGWSDHSTDAEGALCIEAVVEGDALPQHDFAISDCVVSRNMVKIGSLVSVSGVVRNNALATAQGYEVVYSVNDGAATGSVVFADEIAYRQSSAFSLDIPTEGLNEGLGTINLEVRWLDGVSDDYAADNIATASVALYVQGYDRTVLLEEFTTENCGWCPLGFYNINQALDNYNIRDNVVWVCHHNGYYTDFLTASESNQYIQMFGSGGTFAPAMMVDRTFNPTYTETAYSNDGVVGGATMDASYIYDWLSTDMDEPAFVNVEIVSATCVDGVIKVRVRAEKYEAFDAITMAPRINVWVKESHIKMRNQADYSGKKTGYHEHAFRKSLTAVWGDDIVWDDLTFEAEYNCNLGSDWDPEHLDAVAFVSRYSSTVRAREVYNSTETSVSTSEQGITTVNSDTPVSATEYTLDGRIADGNVTGMKIRQQKTADGSISAVKVFTR